jgi:hypothetical protein
LSIRWIFFKPVNRVTNLKSAAREVMNSSLFDVVPQLCVQFYTLNYVQLDWYTEVLEALRNGDPGKDEGVEGVRKESSLEVVLATNS